MSKKKKTDKYASLNEMTDKSVAYTDSMLFLGSPFGGRSLEAILSDYREKGPYTPIRNELLSHLHRCIEQLAEMDALIRARASSLPHVELQKQYKRVLPKQEARRRRT
jgi:hypothetical protein